MSKELEKNVPPAHVSRESEIEKVSGTKRKNGPSVLPTIAAQSMTTGKRRRKGLMLTTRILLALLFTIGIVGSISPWGRASVRTSLLLPALINSQPPAPLQVGGTPITRRSVEISSESGPVYLDIFAPTTPAPLMPGTRGGILILPGSGDHRQYAPLTNLAESFARSGLMVMTMTTPTLIKFDLSADDTDAVVRAFQTLAALPGMQNQPLGIVSFSGGVPLACFAAADPRIRDRITSVTLFGGYFETTSLVRAIGQRALSYDGKNEPWNPIYVPMTVLANVITKALPAAEGERIRQAFPDGVSKPLTPEEIAQLSPPSRAAFALLSGSEPQKVDENIAALPSELHEQFNQLSPSRALGEIRAPIYLLHDRADNSIPFTESRAFAKALTQLQHMYEYVEFSIFDHVIVREGNDVSALLNDGSRLFAILNAMLEPAHYNPLATEARIAFPEPINVDNLQSVGNLFSLQSLYFSLTWLLMGLLVGLLGYAALRMVVKKKAWRKALLLGSIGALAGGWLGLLLFGNLFATPMALWVSVAVVVLGIADLRPMLRSIATGHFKSLSHK